MSINGIKTINSNKSLDNFRENGRYKRDRKRIVTQTRSFRNELEKARAKLTLTLTLT